MGELVGHQLVMGATGRAALGLALVKPEPDHGRVVFLTCKEEGGASMRTHSAVQTEGYIGRPVISSTTGLLLHWGKMKV